MLSKLFFQSAQIAQNFNVVLFVVAWALVTKLNIVALEVQPQLEREYCTLNPHFSISFLGHNRNV